MYVLTLDDGGASVLWPGRRATAGGALTRARRRPWGRSDEGEEVAAGR